MKTLQNCIQENKEFLPSLKKLVEEALEKGEADTQTTFVFLKLNETVVETIITGNNIALFGEHQTMIITYGYNLRELLRICEGKLAKDMK